VRTYQLAHSPAERTLVPTYAKTATPAATPAPPAIAPSAPSAQAVPLALPAYKPGVLTDSATPEQPLGVPLNTRRFYIHIPTDNAIVLNKEPELPARPACAGSTSLPPGPPAEDLEPVHDKDASPRAHYHRRRR
ncbi:hypothetical protein CSAL01_13731, partial [Colletotrichum salicis]